MKITTIGAITLLATSLVACNSKPELAEAYNCRLSNNGLVFMEQGCKAEYLDDGGMQVTYDDGNYLIYHHSDSEDSSCKNNELDTVLVKMNGELRLACHRVNDGDLLLIDNVTNTALEINQVR